MRTLGENKLLRVKNEVADNLSVNESSFDNFNMMSASLLSRIIRAIMFWFRETDFPKHAHIDDSKVKNRWDLVLFSTILFISVRIWMSEMRFSKFLLSLISSMYVEVPLIDNAIWRELTHILPTKSLRFLE